MVEIDVMTTRKPKKTTTFLSGNVKVELIKRNDNTSKEQVEKHNNVSSDFAKSLGQLLFFGVSNKSNIYSSFALPTSVVIVLLNNGATVNSMTTSLSKFTDSVDSTGETTSITYIASDGTHAQYTFDTAELYSVVNGQLFLKIADVTFQSPLTKDDDVILAITWQETIFTALQSGNISTYASSICSSASNPSQCTSNAQHVGTKAGSIINFLWALLIYPNIKSLGNQSTYPISYWTNLYEQASSGTGQNPLPEGIVQVMLLDSNLNTIALVVPTPLAENTVVNPDSVDVIYSFLYNNNTVASYVMPYTEMVDLQGGLIAPIFLVPLENPGQASTGIITISLSIPYGEPTLQNLVVNS